MPFPLLPCCACGPCSMDRVEESPAWQRDEDAAECPRCHRTFGFLLRRHHCRFCGKIFCDRCSSHEWPLPVDPKRVCDGCHKLLQSGEATAADAVTVRAIQASAWPPLAGGDTGPDLDDVDDAVFPPGHGRGPADSGVLAAHEPLAGVDEDLDGELLVECPKCSESLRGLPPEQVEAHLDSCFALDMSRSPKGDRYLGTNAATGADRPPAMSC